MNTPSRRFCIAPMMDWTDRHCRYFLRLISKNTLLYTEMITTGALLHGDTQRFLRFDPYEHPVALQLGGSNPADLALCSQLAEAAGYNEVNLNVGCPSDRVQNGRMGACLMADPKLVAKCISAMQAAVKIPVTVKCRIGIDQMDSYQELADFIKTVALAGCQCFIIHARIALLSGLSPKQNREVPPLNYARVIKIKENFPELEIIINGGITTLDQTQELLKVVDGVMIGREAYHHPYFLASVDRDLFDCQAPPLSRIEIINLFCPYIEKELAQGTALKHITRHILGIFQGQPGAKRYRRYLSENAYKANADINTLKFAVNLLSEPSTIE